MLMIIPSLSLYHFCAIRFCKINYLTTPPISQETISQLQRFYFTPIPFDDLSYITNTLVLCFYLVVRNYDNSIEMPHFQEKIDVQRYALIQFIEENYRNISLSDIASKYRQSHVAK